MGCFGGGSSKSRKSEEVVRKSAPTPATPKSAAAAATTPNPLSESPVAEPVKGVAGAAAAATAAAPNENGSPSRQGSQGDRAKVFGNGDTQGGKNDSNAPPSSASVNANEMLRLNLGEVS